MFERQINGMMIEGRQPLAERLSPAVTRFLASHHDLYYNDGQFAAACQAIGQSSEAEFWSRGLSAIATAQEMLSRIPEDLHIRFIRAYAEAARQTLTI